MKYFQIKFVPVYGNTQKYITLEDLRLEVGKEKYNDIMSWLSSNDIPTENDVVYLDQLDNCLEIIHTN